MASNIIIATRTAAKKAGPILLTSGIELCDDDEFTGFSRSAWLLDSLPSISSIADRNAFPAGVGAPFEATFGDLDGVQAADQRSHLDSVAHLLQRGRKAGQGRIGFELGRPIAIDVVGQGHSLLWIELPVDEPDDGSGDIGDDPAPTGRTQDIAQLSGLIEDQGRRHGAAGAFTRLGPGSRRFSRRLKAGTKSRSIDCSE